MGTVLCILLLLCGLLLVDSIPGEQVRVRISVSGDTVVLQFLLPDPAAVLEGFLLGYGRQSGATTLVTLPAHGAPYQLETEAEPKYLLAVRPVPRKPVEKHCTGVAALDPPLVAGSLSPTAVFLSWGPEPHREGEVMEECLEEGFYTVRYRRRGGPWAHQSSPTAAAVLAGLRPASRYEFRVRASRGQRHGPWSAPLLHSTGPGANDMHFLISSASRLDLWEESEVFSSQPNSDLDAMGKKRFVAPHVVYKTDKRPEEPCSVTSSLLFFPGEKPGESDASTPPQAPPSNLTVVTVEGCPSFIILDWKNTDNHTQEYEVISTATGPDGEEVSVLMTDQTHTVVENLRPESSYAFKVKPKNDLGAGPPSEPVTFSTESADPRVSENASGKDAIWTRFPFRTAPPSDCTGQQYVKRTWYRKFVGVQLCNSLRYKIYLSDSLTGQFYDIGDEAGFGEDHCQFVDSFLDGRTGPQLRPQQLPPRTGFYRAARQEPVRLGPLGAGAPAGYVSWYECGTPIPGRW
uniref:Fibronectin type-III domain-containing protein n=1 Tax=Gadus morhua TaxID=8049 RepID=A0A8C5CF03_GADMO